MEEQRLRTVEVWRWGVKRKRMVQQKGRLKRSVGEVLG